MAKSMTKISVLAKSINQWQLMKSKESEMAMKMKARQWLLMAKKEILMAA